MDGASDFRRLSDLETQWTLVCQAHQGSENDMQRARQRLLERYGGVVQRYLAGAIRDQEAADELAQEFALRFLRGDFHAARPERGRFRQYLKTALFHLVIQYRRQQHKQPLPLGSELPEPAAVDSAGGTAEEDFLRSWRDELLARTWEALRAVEEDKGQPWYTVLRFRADHPELSSGQMAGQLGTRLGKPPGAAAMRQLLHRARERFADLLLDQIAHSLDRPNADEIEAELIELNLYSYCQPALKRRSEG
jgi:DNA-directed RNA polymerase specialized sigma24 family protein